MAEQNENAGRRGKRASGAGETLEAVEEQATGAAQETFDEVGSQAGGATRDGVSRLGEHLRNAAESFLQEQQQRIADATHCLAEALRQTADSLEHDDRAVARYADQAAAQIDRFTETMRSRHFSDLVAGAESVARRQPSLFATGAVAAGFVIGRLLARPAGSQSGPADTP